MRTAQRCSKKREKKMSLDYEKAVARDCGDRDHYWRQQDIEGGWLLVNAFGEVLPHDETEIAFKQLADIAERPVLIERPF
jgi:hypothetical protein